MKRVADNAELVAKILQRHKVASKGELLAEALREQMKEIEEEEKKGTLCKEDRELAAQFR